MSFSLSAQENGYDNFDDNKAKVTMRMIGHEVLNLIGDSISTVLPVSKEKEKEYLVTYRILFDSDITFDPEQLAAVVIPVMEKSGLTTHYIVETQDCATKDVVHSFQIGGINENQIIPCKGRIIPADCYELVVILYKDTLLAHDISSIGSETDKASQIPSVLLLLPLLFLIGLIGFFVKKKQHDEVDPDTVLLGNTRFNTRDRILTFDENEVELSQKEADLLQLLHLSYNQTVPREVLLNKVWGDEGDYIGRTLDVFISKLRKKLDPDNSIKIENIRGVGYKLILNPLT